MRRLDAGAAAQVQILAWVLSYSPANNVDWLALVASSAALLASPIPFDTPIAGVAVGMDAEGRFVVNPTREALRRPLRPHRAAVQEAGRVSWCAAPGSERRRPRQTRGQPPDSAGCTLCAAMPARGQQCRAFFPDAPPRGFC